MSKLDLKDAYLLIPIRKHDRKYLRFYFQDRLYQYNCLCFGINFAPMLFTKLIKPIIQKLRKKGHLSVVYLDDFLLLANSYKDCCTNVTETIRLLESLGFLINYNKSSLKPQKICGYLGFEYNSVDMTICIPTEKRYKLAEFLIKFKNKRTCSIRMFAKTIGKLVSVCPAVDYGYLYTKLFEREKYLALIKHKNNFNAKMEIPSRLSDDFEWWVNKLKSNSKSSLIKNKFILEIFSDASTIGWGVHCGNISSQGIWSEQEKSHHINYLELLAVFFGLKCFAKELSGCSILCRVDNTTAIAYINRMGSVQYPKLNELTRKIWQWCENKHIHIFASYIKSADNKEADSASRIFQIDTEWSLADSVFKKLVTSFGKPTLDLFASRINTKCRCYVSWQNDPDAFAINAFTLDWNKFFFYAFPPFSIILRTLQKIITDGAEGIVVVPVWPTQPWYPLFMSLLLSEPLVFPPDKNLLSVGRTPHPLSAQLSLMGGRLCGRRCS